MNLDGKTIWQIAAGNGDTHYAQLCLDLDVIIVGNGREGAWPSCELPLRASGETSHRIGIVRRFAEEIKPRDIVVLRVGTQNIYGVGEIVGSYGWSRLFDNVQGWSLEHFRRVRWLWHLDDGPKTFPTYTLKLGASVQRLISPTVRCWLEGLDIPDEAYSRALQPLPGP